MARRARKQPKPPPPDATVSVTAREPLTLEVKFKPGDIIASGLWHQVARHEEGYLIHKPKGGRCDGEVVRMSHGSVGVEGCTAHYFRCTRCVSTATRDYLRFSVVTGPGETLPPPLRGRASARE